MSDAEQKVFITAEGETHVWMRIAGPDLKPTHNVSADAVLKALDDAEFWRQRCSEAHSQLEKERARIARLMKALTDEVLGTVKP